MNQSLIDDGLVDKEKLGGSNYFWSFPAKKDRLTQLQHEKVLQAIESLKTDIDEANAALMDARRGREDENYSDPAAVASCSAEVEPKEGETKADDPPAKKPKTMSRAAKLQRLDEIAKLRAAAVTELQALKENDPQALADLEQQLQLTQQAAHRWTDNIFNCQTYLTKKRGMDKKEAMKMLGITSTFDCTYTHIQVYKCHDGS
jgi:Leucine zipper with capping helix domain/Mnd1 HTH domain